MIWNIIFIIMFFILKAIADKISFHFSTSIFSKLPKKYHDFVNPSESWDNKWKNGDKAQGERFFGSSTIFVMFTDLWHFVKFIQYNIISLVLIYNNAFLTPYKLLDFFIYLYGGLIIFELFFAYLFALDFYKKIKIF